MGRKIWYIVGLLMLVQLAACGTAQNDQAGTQATKISTPPPQASATAPADHITIPKHITKKQPTPSKATPTPDNQPVPSASPTARPAASGSQMGSTGAAPPPGTSAESQLTQQLFAQINTDRAASGLPAYTWNATLAAGARKHSITMAGCGLSHACPGEPRPCQRMSNEGVQWTYCGENVGYTSPYPTAWSAVKNNIEQGMLAEQPPNDGHRKNLLSSIFHRIGVGIYIDAKGLVWITEDFVN